MNTANNYTGICDSDIIDKAIKNSENGTVIIPKRCQSVEPERDWWLIDRAILLPENTTVILQNCKIKLSDKCRDNFFRSANCGVGIENVKPISNIHIQGEGKCILEGADHPRSTGDSGKTLLNPCPKDSNEHNYTYGTDAGKEGERQKGDWRNIGILFASVSDFSVRNISIVESHAWGMSFEDCSHGYIDRITFDARMARNIDGIIHNIENQDGVNIRNGCHDIVISNITGTTGDDLVALTAVGTNKTIMPSGNIGRTMVLHNDWTRRDSGVSDIIIRNIRGYSAGGCGIIRLLPSQVKMRNIVIDGVIDTSNDDLNTRNGWGPVINIGDGGQTYGDNTTDDLKFVTISNIICHNKSAIFIGGYLSYATITNVINKNPNCPCITVRRKNGMTNVETSNLITVGKQTIVYEDR